MEACVVIMILLAIVLASLCTTIACKKEGYVLSPGGESSFEGGLSVCPGATVPIGTIVPFYQALFGKDGKLNKSAIPFGWWICDGTPDPDTGVVTPNLSGKYLMGANSSAGLKMMNTNSTFETTLTENQVPLRSHDHGVSFIGRSVWSGGSGDDIGYFAGLWNDGLQKPQMKANVGGAKGSDGPIAETTDANSETAPTEPLKIEFDQYIPNFPIVYIMYVGTKKKDRACADIRVT